MNKWILALVLDIWQRGRSWDYCIGNENKQQILFYWDETATEMAVWGIPLSSTAAVRKVDRDRCSSFDLISLIRARMQWQIFECERDTFHHRLCSSSTALAQGITIQSFWAQMARLLSSYRLYSALIHTQHRIKVFYILHFCWPLRRRTSVHSWTVTLEWNSRLQNLTVHNLLSNDPPFDELINILWDEVERPRRNYKAWRELLGELCVWELTWLTDDWNDVTKW